MPKSKVSVLDPCYSRTESHSCPSADCASLGHLHTSCVHHFSLGFIGKLKGKFVPVLN